MTAPLNVALLLEDMDFGGTQRYALHLAAGLDPARYRVVIWTLRGGDGFVRERALAHVEIVHLTQARRVGPLALVRLARMLLRSPPDVLYTLTAIPNIWGRLAAGLLRVPLVSGYRSMRPGQHERFLHRFSDAIIANAPQLVDLLLNEEGAPRHKLVCIPNGVEIPPLPEVRREAAAPSIVCVARREPVKDLPTLVAAFQILRRSVPDARLTIIGDGSVELDRSVEGFEILPGSTNVREALSSAWVFALSSREEGAPNAVLEAMANAAPVVATAVGGVPDIVVDGQTGLLVAPGEPEVMAAALATLLGDATKRAEIGQAGRRRVQERYCLSAMIEATGDVLSRVARARAKGA